MIIDLTKMYEEQHASLYINGAVVDGVGCNFEFIDVHVISRLVGTLLPKKALKKPQKTSVFCHCIVERILSDCIIVYLGSYTAISHKALNRAVIAAEQITGSRLGGT